MSIKKSTKPPIMGKIHSMEVAAPKKTHIAFKTNMANIICSVQYAQIIESALIALAAIFLAHSAYFINF